MSVDKAGHCVVCGVNLVVVKVVNYKEVETLSPLYDQVEFILNTGAKMKVGICGFNTF